MLLIKLTAAEVRQIEAPAPVGTDLIEMLKKKVAEAKVLKELGATPKLRKDSMRWGEAWKVCHEVLGARLVRPEVPEPVWFTRIASKLRADGATPESLKALAEYAVQHLRRTVDFDFLIMQSRRILAGEFDTKQPVSAETVIEGQVRLPEE